MSCVTPLSLTPSLPPAPAPLINLKDARALPEHVFGVKSGRAGTAASAQKPGRLSAVEQQGAAAAAVDRALQART